MQPDPPPPTLSPRQAQIFALLAEGFIYEEIAARMGIRTDVVRHYAQSAKARLKATTMFEAAVIAAQCGLIPQRAVIEPENGG